MMTAIILGQQTVGSGVLRFLSDRSEAFSAIESIATSFAILVAGGWALWHFRLQRRNFPCAELSHDIEYWDFSETHRLLRVSLTIKNTSEVLLRVLRGHTWVQQMKPWPQEVLNSYVTEGTEVRTESAEIPWPLIKEKLLDSEREFEPKESESVTVDFIIDKYYEQVLIYTHIENLSKPGRHLGWTASRVVDFMRHSEGKGSAEHVSLPDCGVDHNTGQSQSKARPPLAKNSRKHEKRR